MGETVHRAALAAAAVLLGAGSVLAVCGPFTDVAEGGLCPNVLEILTLGITTGTSPTTYDPTGHVSRLQMAAFLSRTVDQVLSRGSRRVFVKKTWYPRTAAAIGITTLPDQPYALASDGTDVWVAGNLGRISRVRASDGKLLETWTGATGPAAGILPVMRRVFIGGGNSGNIYQLDPALPAGAVTTVASLPSSPGYLAFDGARLWSADFSGSVSILTPGPTIPWTALTVTTGFVQPSGILHDGANIWITDSFANRLHKLDSAGTILQTVTVGDHPFPAAFDGTNIWVPNVDSDSVSVVRAATGAVLATLTGNGLFGPRHAAFDGQAVLIVNSTSSPGVSLWKAANLTPIGSFPLPSNASGAWSDGTNFWLNLVSASKLGRF